MAMRKPVAQKGAAANPKRRVPAGVAGMVRPVGPINSGKYLVQGSAATPYEVDLDFNDVPAGIDHTTHCTCPAWAIGRNRKVNTPGYVGFSCKHVNMVNQWIGTQPDRTAIDAAEEQAIKARSDAIRKMFTEE